MKNMEKLTRDQINKKLEILRRSRLNEESYVITRPAMAMCYSMSYPKECSKLYVCVTCGKEFKVSWRSNSSATIEDFEKIVERFRAAGVEAELVCNCEECVAHHGCNRYEIRIKTEEERDWHFSFPNIERRFGAEDQYTSDFEYELVLKFLTVPEKIKDLYAFFDHLYNFEFRKRELEFYVGSLLIQKQVVEPFEKDSWELSLKKKQMVIDRPELFYSGKKPIDFYAEKNLTTIRAIELINEHIQSGGMSDDYIFHRFMSLFSETFQELTYKGLNGNEVVHDYDNAGFIKTQTDIALNKVLGLTVIYDAEEVRRNIEYIFQNRDMRQYIEQAYAILEQMDKKEFTVWEYAEFMKELYDKIQYPLREAKTLLRQIINEEIMNFGQENDELLRIGIQWLKNSNRQTISKGELKTYALSDLIVQAEAAGIDVSNIKRG